MPTVPAVRLAEVFAQVADTLVHDFDVIEFLHLVTSYTAELANVEATGLLLADQHGELQFMAASDERTELLELFQVQTHEGPCHDCFRLGTRVVADLGDSGERWPGFAPRAVAAGFGSVHAFPLRLRVQVIGAMNLFGTDPGPMAAADARIVQALADIVTIGLLQERTIRRSELLVEQLQGALNSRVVIEQAKGAISQIHRCTPEVAFELLRAYSRRHRLRLSEVAQAIATDPTGIPDLTA